jgi:hypothetical protein
MAANFESDIGTSKSISQSFVYYVYYVYHVDPADQAESS